eukprot:TRINITY_DN1479_c0_g1_i1.p1 TRINITY_DN1479_c0_g1~~TRINITY_DN1479_c0_g1_i1.p1  ORF type:complete len:223 (+),score=70.62 TRINITY_DN1479_c0_g1_i1:27-695(+)
MYLTINSVLSCKYTSITRTRYSQSMKRKYVNSTKKSDWIYKDGLLYTPSHEWIQTIDTDTALVGITDFSQQYVGDICFVELPSEGQKIDRDEKLGSIESYKAVSDVYAPVTGTVIEVNEKLNDDPKYINNSPYEEGWFAKMKIDNVKELDNLMDRQAYEKFVEENEDMDSEMEDVSMSEEEFKQFVEEKGSIKEKKSSEERKELEEMLKGQFDKIKTNLKKE